MKLARFQLETAPLNEGTVVLEASAGTGKTYTLVGILLRMLLEGQLDRLDEALVVTFTVAATEELKNRLRAALQETLRAVHGGSKDAFLQKLARQPDAARRLQKALDDFDLVSIATIHGFCKRLLEESAFESREPFQVEFAVDPLPLLYRAAADSLRCLYSPQVTMQSAVLHDAKLAPASLVALYRLWQRHPAVQMDPEVAAPADHLTALENAVAAAAAAWDGEAERRLLAMRWRKGNCPIGTDPQFWLANWRALLAKDPRLVLPSLCDFAASEIEEHILKSSPRGLDHPFFTACDAVSRLRIVAVAHVRAQLLHRMHERLAADKRRDHVLSFQDLLERTHTALHDPLRAGPLLASLHHRYRVALIDEFQDTDPLQYGIFAMCFAHRPLFLIGDPKQAIYGFRGADLQTYLAARSRAIGQATLDKNFRSSAALVHAQGLLFGRDLAFVQDGVGMPIVQAAASANERLLHGDDGAALRWRFVPPDDSAMVARDVAEERIVADVSAEISRLLRGNLTLDGRRLQPHDIAVLTRTNAQATILQEQLREAGIVSAIGKAGDVFKTDELIELERLLLAVLLPGDLSRARAAMTTRLWGFDAHGIAALEADEARFDDELDRLEQWRRLWLRRGFVVMKEQLLVDLGAPARLLSRLGGERRMANFQQLFELLHEAEHAGRLSPEGLLEWLQRERRHQEELDYQLRELRLESDDDAVQILTVHGSKGLEFEVVFCPFLWDSRNPSKNAVVPAQHGRELVFDLRKADPRWHAADEERLAEDVRLCYVAMTRARRRCYVYWGPIGSSQSGSWRSALAWLLSPHPAERPANPDGTRRHDWLDLWANRGKADMQLLAGQLQQLVLRSGGTMDFHEVPDSPEPEPVLPATLPVLRAALRPARKVRARALHSFSSLTADASPGDAARELTESDLSPGMVTAGGRDGGQPQGIFAFARGAAAGQCLHSILERCNLGNLDGKALEIVRETLSAHGLAEASAHAGELDPVATVLQNLRDLAAARIGPEGPNLAALTAGPRVAEWQFLLPTSHSELRHLAQMFAQSSSPAAREQAPRLFHLPARTLRGFLTGFVDLVCEHQGRHWILDWKSNHLGNGVDDYKPDSLAAAMRDHDYVLQYHLYVLALHRHLRQRCCDYDYERHVGGACYAFLRGVVPGTDRGMVVDRVPLELVNAMDQWAEGRFANGQA